MKRVATVRRQCAADSLTKYTHNQPITRQNACQPILVNNSQYVWVRVPCAKCGTPCIPNGFTSQVHCNSLTFYGTYACYCLGTTN